MTALSDKLLARHYGGSEHPYRSYELAVDRLLPKGGTLLDAGCGRSVPVLRKYLGRAGRLIGVELVDFTDVPAGIETYNADLAKLPLPDACVDLIMSRSVFEHLADPDSVYREFAGAQTRRCAGVPDRQHVGLRHARGAFGAQPFSRRHRAYR